MNNPMPIVDHRCDTFLLSVMISPVTLLFLPLYSPVRQAGEYLSPLRTRARLPASPSVRVAVPPRKSAGTNEIFSVPTQRPPQKPTPPNGGYPGPFPSLPPRRHMAQPCPNATELHCVSQRVSFATLREGLQTLGLECCKCLLQNGPHEIRLPTASRL